MPPSRPSWSVPEVGLGVVAELGELRMALTFGKGAASAGRTWELSASFARGLRIVHAKITIGDAENDYGATGIDIGSNAAAMGLTTVFGAFGGVVRASAGTPKALLSAYDPVNGLLIFYQNASDVGEFPIATYDVDIVDGDIVEVFVLGV